MGEGMRSKLNNYYYLDSKQLPLRVRARVRPSEKHRRGLWIVQEFSDGKWTMPCFPEIHWGILKKLTYIGKTPVVIQEVKNAL